MTTINYSVALFWWNSAPMHFDKAFETQLALGDRNVSIIYGNGTSRDYTWTERDLSNVNPNTTTLNLDDLIPPVRIIKLIHELVKTRSKIYIFCNYHRPEVIISAVVLRLLNRVVYLMGDTKFIDRPRSAWKEYFKSIIFKIYQGAIVSGPRAKSYAQFLGVPEDRIYFGYDTIKYPEKKQSAAPVIWENRYFLVVARLIEEKNLNTLMRAYELYVNEVGADRARPLVIAGSGPLEHLLDPFSQRLGHLIKKLGHVEKDHVADLMEKCLAVILVSKSESWGLVIAEAICSGRPVITTENVGASDLLVENLVNGYVFKDNNIAGIAKSLFLLSVDEALWASLAEASLERTSLTRTDNFVNSIIKIRQYHGRKVRGA